MFEISEFLKSALKAALTIILTAFLISYLQNKASDSNAIRKQGIRMLKFPFQFQLMTAGGLAMFIFVPTATIFIYGYNHVALLFVFLIIFFSTVFYQVFLCTVYWDRSGVYWRSIFGGKRCILWDECPEFGGASTFQSEYIQGKSARIWYSSYCHGAKQLEKMVARARRSKN